MNLFLLFHSIMHNNLIIVVSFAVTKKSCSIIIMSRNLLAIHMASLVDVRCLPLINKLHIWWQFTASLVDALRKVREKNEHVLLHFPLGLVKQPSFELT
uniref:Putative phenylalaninetRNA ligase beta subunit n=1 Tax=Rhizophora mucronata TaxID=61149 RepID=A0A2P2MTN7_RHIMU